MKYYLSVKINQYIQRSTTYQYTLHTILDEFHMHNSNFFKKSQNTTYSMIPLNTAKNKQK